MASEPGAPTLDQLRIFLTIVDTGSFAAAARTLNRANSVISYAIANLEAQLGFPLFDRESTRRPQLTAAGRSILAEARTVSDGIAGLRAKARGLMRGLEPEVHLVVDVMLPTERLVDALTAFRDEFPTVALRLRVEALGAVTQLVLDGVAGIGISGPMPGLAAHPAIEPIRVGEVELVSVAAPKHPLAKIGRNLHAKMREHVQLVLSDRSELTKSVDFAVISPRTWRLSDLGAKLLLLRAGIGWGNMPLPMVQEDLDSGSLVRLDPPGARLHLRVRGDLQVGLATRSRRLLVDRAVPEPVDIGAKEAGAPPPNEEGNTAPTTATLESKISKKLAFPDQARATLRGKPRYLRARKRDAKSRSLIWPLCCIPDFRRPLSIADRPRLKSRGRAPPARYRSDLWSYGFRNSDGGCDACSQSRLRP